MIGMLFFSHQPPFLETIDVSYYALDEQTPTLLLHAVWAVAAFGYSRLRETILPERGPLVSVSSAFFLLLECAVNLVTHRHTHTHNLVITLFLIVLYSQYGCAVGIECGRGTCTGSVWLLCLEISCLVTVAITTILLSALCT